MMFEVSKEFEVHVAPRIDKSSDSVTERAIKSVILQMLQSEPSNRITAAEVVKELTKLKGNKTEVKKPTAAQQENKGIKTKVEQPTAAKEEHKGSKTKEEQPTAAQEDHKGSKTKVQQPRFRMPKWWPGSKN